MKKKQVEDYYEMLITVDPDLKQIITREDFISSYDFFEHEGNHLKEDDFVWNDTFEEDRVILNSTDDEGNSD